MPTPPPANSSSSILAEKTLSLDLDLPEFSEAEALLMEKSLPVTFAEQIAHARLLLKWKNGHYKHPPRQLEPFVM